jgi:hypothetical protein
MNPFDNFPRAGRELLGRPIAGNGSSRTGYGLSHQRITSQSGCAYCGVDLTGDYYRWLLLTVDHVVPAGEAIRLGVPESFYQDAINLVLACSGCNGFLNRYRCDAETSLDWSLEQLVTLRDKVFEDRHKLIAARRNQEVALFERRPWAVELAEQPASRSARLPFSGSSPAPVDGLVTFTDNDAGYLAWLEANPAGFVVNTPRSPIASYLMLHRAKCRTIGPQPARGSKWTADYVKMCSMNIAVLHDWARREVGGELRPCQRCRPPVT